MIINEITDEYLKELDQNTSMISLSFDLMFKSFFMANEYIFKRFLISVLHLRIKPENCKLYIINNDMTNLRYKEYHKVVDFNININNYIYVNLEVNTERFEDIKYRNEKYLDSISSSVIDKGKNIKIFKKSRTIQLNLNVNEKNSKIGEDIIYRVSKVTGKIFNWNNVIYLRYLDYYKKLYYNQDIKKSEADYWLATITANSYTELNNMYKCFLSDEIRLKLMKDVIRLNMDELIVSENIIRNLEAMQKYSMEEKRKSKLRYDLKKAQKLGLKQGFEQGIEQGIEQGFEQGIEANRIAIAKNLLKKDLSLDLISETTGLTIEQLKKLQ